METRIIKNAKGQAGGRPIRFLALDGGGMRGYYSAIVLEHICRRFAPSHRDADHFDVGASFDGIVGVSTGAIIAAALAKGHSPLNIARFYETSGPQIFQHPVPAFELLPKWMSVLSFLIFALSHLRRPFNSDESLRHALDGTLSSVTFNEIFKTRRIALLIPAVNLATNRMHVFKTPHFEGKHRDNDVTLVDACLASTAAPYFFPVAYANNRPFVDGGLAANNPLLLALIEALEITKNEPDRPIEIVSIGTCPSPLGSHVTPDTREWGLLQWRLVERFGNVVLDAQMSMQAQTLSFLIQHIERDITIFRFPQSVPSREQANCIALDRADSVALATLESLGRADAEMVHSDAWGSDGADLEKLKNIFSSVSTM